MSIKGLWILAKIINGQDAKIWKKKTKKTKKPPYIILSSLWLRAAESASCWAQSTHCISDKDPHQWNPLSPTADWEARLILTSGLENTAAGTAAFALNTQTATKDTLMFTCKHKTEPVIAMVRSKTCDTYIYI